ncbi:MAG: hypothetical protein BWZ08_02359 [candidate division BRC1 bacterium ADurb.BinA292]|nr:MAG: hypothetical protein BWZ08_02359 [candidate division BRC1 bacterium ADurb.BinA292]
MQGRLPHPLAPAGARRGVRRRRQPAALLAPAPPRLGQRAHQLARNFAQEERRRIVGGTAIEPPLVGPAQEEQIPGARDPDIEQPPLLLEVPLVDDGALAREDRILHPDQEHDAELQPLGAVQRHQRNGRLVRHVVLGIDQRHALEEIGKRCAGAVRLEVLQRVKQFADVLAPRDRVQIVRLAQAFLVVRLAQNPLQHFVGLAVRDIGLPGFHPAEQVEHAGARLC